MSNDPTMTAMAAPPKKVSRTYLIDEDVITVFEAWNARTRCKFQDAVELGIWLVMGLTGDMRDKLLEMMDDRVPVQVVPVAIGEPEEETPAEAPGSPVAKAVEQAADARARRPRQSAKSRRRASGDQKVG